MKKKGYRKDENKDLRIITYNKIKFCYFLLYLENKNLAIDMKKYKIFFSFKHASNVSELVPLLYD